MNHTNTSGSGAAMAKARDNETLRCSVPNCGQLRKGLSPLCYHHNWHHEKHGHWRAKPIPLNAWKLERNEVTALFAANLNHPGLVSAMAYLEGFLKHRTANVKANEELERLCRAQVTPLQIITELAAAMVWLDRARVVFPDERSEDFVWATAFLSLAPRPRNMSPSALRASPNGMPIRATPGTKKHLGGILRRTLGVFLITAASAVKEQAEAMLKATQPHQLDYRAVHAPFNISQQTNT